jgi:hypothetical protein
MSSILTESVLPRLTSETQAAALSAKISGRIILDGKFLLVTAIMLMLTPMAGLLDLGNSALDNGFLVALCALLASMFLVRALYVRAERFMFSPSFWLVVTFFFYFLLKSLELWSKGMITPTLVEAIWLGTLFLISYVPVYAWQDSLIRKRAKLPADTLTETVIAPGATWALLAVYAAFKLLGIALFASVDEGDALAVSAATQNAGAAYLYRIPIVGNIVLLALLYNAFKHDRGWTAALLAISFFLTEAVLSTNRLSLVMVVIWSAFLYHRYRSPISLWRLALMGSPLMLVVVLFGYARNIEVGSVSAYLEAAGVLIEQPNLISELFLHRMDMLPQLVDALDLYREGMLPDLNGASYVYAFLHAVPRSLWEAKPLLTAALATSETNPLAFADGVNIFPSILFEGMVNLSYVGVVLSGVLIAFLSRQLERAIEADRLVPSVWALSLLTFPMALFNEGLHSNFTGNLLYLTAMTAMLYQVIKVFGLIRRRRSPA